MSLIREHNYKNFNVQKHGKESDKMKKILSLALVASLMLGTVAVKAETKTTDVVKLYDFNSLTAGTVNDTALLELGITASTDGNAEMSIVDLSEDTTYGSLGKVLQYKPTSATSEAGVQTTYIQFPMSYELNSDETLVVEYDMRYFAEKKDKTDWFNSTNWGNVGLSSITLDDGGNGRQLALVPRNARQTVTLADSRDTISYVATQEWLKVRIVYDYDEYLKYNVANDKTSKGITATVTKIKDGNAVSVENGTSGVATGWLNNTTAGNLVFNEDQGKGLVQLDNIHVYTVPKFKLNSTSIANEETGVFCDTKTVTAQFTNDIADASAVTVSKDGAQISASEYSVSKSGNTVTVTFANDLTYSSNYVISYTGITDTLGQTLDEKTVSFTVEPMPDIMLGSLKLAKGIGAAYEEVSELNASNGLQSISLDLENTTSEAKNVNVIFALYEGESRVLSSMQHIETSIPANETKEVSIGVDMTGSQGKLVKAFVWDTFSSMKPWIGNTQLEVK